VKPVSSSPGAPNWAVNSAIEKMSSGLLTGRSVPSGRLWTGAVPMMTGRETSTRTGATMPVAVSSQ
jgi:hypothetical protein